MTIKQRLLLLIFVIKYSLCSVNDSCSTDTGRYNYYSQKGVIDCNCDPSPCIRKCCQNGFKYFPNEDSCEEINETLLEAVEFYYWDKTQISLNTDYGFKIRKLKCKPRLSFKVTDNLFQNGSYKLLGGNIDNMEYCINRDINTLNYYFCPIRRQSTNGEIIQKMTCIGGLLSIPFLLATLLVYALLSERNVHRNALMFHSLSLTLYCILLAFQYYTLSYINKHYTLCLIAGYLKLFFKSAAYFSINVIFLDFWLVVRNIKRGLAAVQQHSDKKKFHLIVFSIYAWGMPGLFLLMILLGGRISEDICYLEAPEYRMFDFFPGAVLYLFNVVLFILITRDIQKIKSQIAKVESFNDRSYDQFSLYWNLFFIVSCLTIVNLCGSAELLSSNFSRKYAKSLDYTRAIVNFTYGMGIFILYVCRKQARKAVKERFDQITRLYY